MKYIIEDWAGNVCFKDEKFQSFEDAEAFLDENFKDLSDDDYEVERGEYWIVEAK